MAFRFFLSVARLVLAEYVKAFVDLEVREARAARSLALAAGVIAPRRAPFGVAC